MFVSFYAWGITSSDNRRSRAADGSHALKYVDQVPVRIDAVQHARRDQALDDP